MSQSMINTLAPVCASEMAVLTAVVVLPSDGTLLLTRIVLGGLLALERSNDVRNCRYVSDIEELPAAETSDVISRVSTFFILPGSSRLNLPSRLLAAGMMPSVGRRTKL